MLYVRSEEGGRSIRYTTSLIINYFSARDSCNLTVHSSTAYTAAARTSASRTEAARYTTFSSLPGLLVREHFTFVLTRFLAGVQ